MLEDWTRVTLILLWAVERRLVEKSLLSSLACLACFPSYNSK